jgi:hypothetical protein
VDKGDGKQFTLLHHRDAVDACVFALLAGLPLYADCSSPHLPCAVVSD